MSQPTSVLSRVKRIVSAELGADPAHIDEDSTIASLGGDSLTSVEIVLLIEDEFGITIPDGEMTKIETIADIVACVEKNGGIPI